MFKSILLSYDGSEHARCAARYADELAREQSHPVTIWLVCVVEDVPKEIQEPYLDNIIGERAAAGRALIEEGMQIIGGDSNDNITIKRSLLFGDPAESIINVAETRACDLIVMGTRGLGPLRSLLLGSKAQKVVSMAKCPVLLVKE